MVTMVSPCAPRTVFSYLLRGQSSLTLPVLADDSRGRAGQLCVSTQ